jgi:uncharacterized delta-60 repeat protein
VQVSFETRRKPIRFALLVLTASVLGGALCTGASALPGALDRSFSGDGKLTTKFTRGFDQGSAVAIQADGRIVVAGDADFDRFALARYNRNGTLDPDFAGDGKVTTAFPGGSAAAFAVAIQSDGKIVAAGWSFPQPSVGGGVFSLARYNPDGSLDSTFGTGGRVQTDIGDGNERAHGVSTQTDGKIVAAGWADDSHGDNRRVAVVRYNADGTLDSTFGDAGLVLTAFAPAYDSAGASALAIQADGALVVAGEVESGGDPETGRFALARYNSDGSLDSTFSGNGKVTTNFRCHGFACSSDSANDLAIQADGRIVAAGGASGRFALARYNTNGSLDSTFSGNGKLTTRFPGGSGAAGVAIQTDGRIVAAGVGAIANRRSGFALARYKTNGALDRTFSSDGMKRTDFTRWHDGASAVALQANGKIVAVGTATRRFALARYRAG